MGFDFALRREFPLVKFESFRLIACFVSPIGFRIDCSFPWLIRRVRFFISWFEVDL
jgi:hypothetical protein